MTRLIENDYLTAADPDESKLTASALVPCHIFSFANRHTPLKNLTAIHRIYLSV